jgi:hypothetical protein
MPPVAWQRIPDGTSIQPEELYMTTHLEVHPSAPARRRTESAYAQRIREAAFNNMRMALGPESIRWVTGLMLLANDGDLEALAIDEFEEAVRLAISAMNALPVAELDQIATRFGL